MIYATGDTNGSFQRFKPKCFPEQSGMTKEDYVIICGDCGGVWEGSKEDGILNSKAPDFEEQYWMLRRMSARFRGNHHSWWKQELPDPMEYEEAKHSLERVNYEVDYIITHCAPNSIADKLGGGGYAHDHLIDFLEEVRKKAKFHYWLFGHCHDNKIIDDRSVLLWEQIVQVI